MQAIVVGPGGTVRSVDDYPRPARPAGWVRLRLRLAGICQTDLEIVKGYMGFQGVLGHEFVGEVVEADPAAADWLGRRVVGEINCACGACPTCQAGRPTHCPARTVLGILNQDGAFADELVLPLTNLHAVPDSLADEAAVFVEPLAAAFEILEQGAVRPTDRVLVLGDGRLGLLIAQVIGLIGAPVRLAGRHPAKLARAAALGLATVLVDDLADATFDVVVEATGRAAGFAEALRRTRARGTLVLKSTVADGASLNLAPLVIDEITLIGSRCGPFAPALQALAVGRVQVQPLIDGAYRLAQGPAALARAAAPGTFKILLRP